MTRRSVTLAAVIAAEPSLSPAQVTDAFDAAVTTGAAVGHLARALAADPRALHVGAPPVAGRLATTLAAAGSATFAVPVCAICGRAGQRLFRGHDGGTCARCRSWQLAAGCVHCGRAKPVAARTADGQPMCERCRRARQARRPCGICGTVAAIAVRGGNGLPDVCAACYRLPEAVCGRCGRTRPCNFADTDEPVCKACADRAPTTCAHCGHDRPATARWPEGPVCEPCYRATLSRRGHCADCGRDRRLVDPPGPAASRCADCAGTGPPGGHVCDDCGTEERLFERGRCARCALARRATRLLAGDQPIVPAHLAGVRDAIAATRQPRSALNWLRRGASATLLGEVATGRIPLTHEALDGHPQQAAADYLRRMLVAHGLLPDRDEDLSRAHRWTTQLLEGIGRPADRLLVTTYANWRVLRRLRRRAGRNSGPRTPTAHARNQLATTVGFLDWLADHQLALATLNQPDLDRWLSQAGPGGHHVGDFLTWAAEQGHCRPLDPLASTRRPGSTIDPDQRWALLARLLHDTALQPTDRLAGALLLCYAQPLSHLTAMTTDQIDRQPDGTTTIRFGPDPIELPQPLAEILRQHLATPRPYIGVGAPASSPWLFPGHLPGQPLTASQLGLRLRRLAIPTRASRRAALLHLAAHLPAAVLGDLLNLSAGTAVRWVNHAGGDWSRYAAAIVNQHHHQPPE